VAEVALDELEAKWGENMVCSFSHGVPNGIFFPPISNTLKRLGSRFTPPMPLKPYIVNSAN
jgi:hypothetical protein